MADASPSQLTIVTVLKDDNKGFLRTATSLFQQIDKSFEWVIIDGSRDIFVSEFLSKEIIEPIRITYVKENPQGIYHAMNLGWRSATGEFVLFLNAGDFFARSDSTQIILSNTSEEFDFFGYAVIHVNAKNEFYDISTPNIIDVSKSESHANINHQGVVMKKSILEALGGFDETFLFAADSKLLDESLRISRYCLLNDILVAFTYGGVSSQNHKKVWDEILRYRTLMFSTFDLWLMNQKSGIRKFLLDPHPIWFLRHLSKLFIKMRMRSIMRRHGAQIKTLDLLNH
jgi:glycosyltransferase involved in cell wall biosynthesis